MITSLHLLLPLLLVPAKLLGVLGRKYGIPVVVGEIFTGLVLGPAVLGILPSMADASEGYHVFHEFAQIGLCVLLFRIGLETDLREFLGVWRAATGVATVGMIFPFLFGTLVSVAFGWSVMVSVFVGATLTATSIGVTVSVLEELGVQRSREGRIILGAAVLDDVLGLVLLAGIVALATPGGSVVGPVLTGFAQAVVFIVGGILVGPWIVRVFMRVAAWAKNPSVFLVFAFAYLLVMSWAAHAIGLAMIIGAYAAGLAYGRHPEHKLLNQNLRPLIDLVTPLFFILIGASIELDGFSFLTSEGRALVFGFLVLLAAATVGKLFSPLLVNCGPSNRLAIGSGMMPRGEVGFVFAQMGFSVGLFNGRQYSVLTLVIVATTIIGPLSLRYFWGTDVETGKASLVENKGQRA